MYPFQPIAHSTQVSNVGASAVQLTIPSEARAVLIDNRGSDDVLIEFFDAPADGNSARVAGGAAQIFSTSGNSVWLKRKSGATAADVVVTPGMGI